MMENGSPEIKRKPCCSKCRNHSVISHLKGHKRRCLYRDCQCPKCHLVDARRDISKRQIALRRLQIEEEEYGSTSMDYDLSSGFGTSVNYNNCPENPVSCVQQPTNQRTWYQSPIRAPPVHQYYHPDFSNPNPQYPYSTPPYRYPSVPQDMNSAGNSQNTSEDDDTSACL